MSIKRLRPIVETWSEADLAYTLRRPDLVIAWLADRAGAHAYLVSADWDSILMRIDSSDALLVYLPQCSPSADAEVFKEETETPDKMEDVRMFITGLKNNADRWRAFKNAHGGDQEMFLRVDR